MLNFSCMAGMEKVKYETSHVLYLRKEIFSKSLFLSGKHQAGHTYFLSSQKTYLWAVCQVGGWSAIMVPLNPCNLAVAS